MKKLLTFLLFCMVFMGTAHAEMFLWQDTVVDQPTQIVKYHAFYQFEDTSANNVGRHKNIPIEFLYNVQSLPFALTTGSVDYCNFTVQHYKHEYNSDGNIINTTTEITNFFFTTNASVNTGEIDIDMVDLDQLVGDMDCHYTSNQSLYQDNVLVGQFATFMPSFECKGCTDSTLTEQSQDVERDESTVQDSLSMYNSVFNLTKYNFLFWTYAFWFIKIALIFVGLGLVFVMFYFMYVFVKGIAT